MFVTFLEIFSTHLEYQDEMGHQEMFEKKVLGLIKFLVGDFNISDIFDKIQNLN